MRSSFVRQKSSRTAVALLALTLIAGRGEADPESAPPENPSSSTTDAVLEATQVRYEAVRDIQAEFVQKSVIASLGREEVARGRVFVRRPGRMRWEYDSPEPRVIAIDGEALRIYTPADKQLQIASLATGAFSPTALDFLLGEGELRDTFSAEALPDAGDGLTRLKLTPKDDARFEHLELWVEADTHRLAGSVLVDVLGNRTEVRFNDVVENAGVAEERFTVEVPKGTDVIDLR